MFFSRRKNDDLSEKLVKLVVPIAIQQFMLALVSATDAVMLGFVDQTSLSAASLAGQIQFVLNLFIAGITAGSGIMISQYWGKKDIKAIEKVMPVALYANLLSGGIFTILALLIPEGLIRIFTNEQGLKATVIATDGIAVIVNKDNKVGDLKKEQVEAIFTGKITEWNKL